MRSRDGGRGCVTLRDLTVGYGERVAIEFVAHLRQTLRFDSVDALIDQMTQDVDRCRAILSAIVPS